MPKYEASPLTLLQCPYGEEGTLIREMRKQSGLSQVALARKIGTTQDCISRWESVDDSKPGKNKPNAESMLKIMRACGRKIVLVALRPGEVIDG